MVGWTRVVGCSDARCWWGVNGSARRGGRDWGDAVGREKIIGAGWRERTGGRGLDEIRREGDAGAQTGFRIGGSGPQKLGHDDWMGWW